MNLKKKLLFITKKKSFKKLIIGFSNRKSGVNFSGKKTIRNRGFISRKKKRYIDYFRAFWHIRGLVLNFEYDPNRKTLINLVVYYNGIFSYLIAIEASYIYMPVSNGNKFNLVYNYNTILKNIPKNIKISNLESGLFKGSKFIRSSNTFAKILNKDKNNCLIKLRSKKVKMLNKYCTATIGAILNFNYHLNKYKKASSSRLKGFRPVVRGVAMNPVDHPHGGGEGKKSKKTSPMSPWGKKLNFKKLF